MGERSQGLSSLSAVIGWTYFACWTASFYPQAISNCRRRSVVGMSLDFQLFNLLGYLCYSIYTCTLIWNKTIRDEYSDVFASNLVTLPDCFFALHGLAQTAFQIGQCFVFERGGQRLSLWSMIPVFTVVLVSLCFALVMILRGGSSGPTLTHGIPLFSWLCWIYWISLIKLGVTILKYVPQVKLNYDNKSTVGWSIGNVLLDFVGGALSITQLILDGATLGWSGVVGDPIKFALGFVSMVFDAIFMVQHYVLYPDRVDKYDHRPLAQNTQGGPNSIQDDLREPLKGI